MSTEPVISIVDDDEAVRETTMDLLNSMGFSTKAFPNPDAFLKSSDVRRTSCLVADMRMPGMTGLELHERLAGSGNRIPTILITAFPNEEDRTRAGKAGVTCYLAKPFGDEALLECVHSALRSGEAG